MALSRLRSEAALCACLSLCALAVSGAQRGTVFRGFVTDSARAPISGVEVTMLEAGRVARTDSTGVFVFRGLVPGTYHVVVRHPRYHPLDGTVRLADGDSIDYQMPRMRRLAPTLDTVRVNEATAAPWWQSEFDKRRATVRGAFITRDVLEERATWPLTNIIASKAAGIRLVQRQCGGGVFCGWALASNRPSACLTGCQSAPLCFLAVWLDGSPIYLPTAGRS